MGGWWGVGVDAGALKFVRCAWVGVWLVGRGRGRGRGRGCGRFEFVRCVWVGLWVVGRGRFEIRQVCMGGCGPFSVPRARARAHTHTHTHKHRFE